MEQYSTNQKKCLFCGRFFSPKKHVGSRQISCLRPECRKKRTQAQQAKWRKRNPDYFKGRYEYVKEWRKANPGYQKRWRAKNTDKRTGEIQTLVLPDRPVKSIHLDLRAKRPLGEIQTLVVTLTPAGISTYSGRQLE